MMQTKRRHDYVDASLLVPAGNGRHYDRYVHAASGVDRIDARRRHRRVRTLSEGVKLVAVLVSVAVGAGLGITVSELVFGVYYDLVESIKWQIQTRN